MREFNMEFYGTSEDFGKGAWPPAPLNTLLQAADSGAACCTKYSL